MLKFFTILFSMTLLTTAQAANKAWFNVEKAAIEGFKRSKTIGASLYYLHNGKTEGALNLGYADLKTKRKTDENTIYHWASITKTFTAIAIMQLVEEGKIKLSDPIVKYLPELSQVHNPYGKMKDITLKMLISHSSGFRSSTWPWSGGENFMPFEPTKWSQLVAMLPYTKIHFKPGSKYQYSNPAIIFLGMVIEKISGEDFEIYINKNIFMPLEMTRSYFDITPRHLLKHRSNSYYVENGETDEIGLDFDTGITTSNGGLNAPLKDMVKYLNFLLSTGNKQVYEGILKRKTLEKMWRAVVPVEENDDWREEMAYSFFLYNHKKTKTKYIGHTGSQAGFFTFFNINPKTKSAIIMVTNSRTRSEEREYMFGIRKLAFETLLYK